MSLKIDPRISRVQQTFQKLATGARTLNNLSDQVGKTVDQFDAALQRMNLGVSDWVRFEEIGSEDGMTASCSEVGYGKIEGKWGLAIRAYDEDERVDEWLNFRAWLFNDAPRALRLKAIDKLPDLFEKLEERVRKTTETLESKLREIRELAEGLNVPAPADSVPRIAPPVPNLRIRPVTGRTEKGQ